MNPLKSVSGTIVAGFVLAILILLATGDGPITAIGAGKANSLIIWLHVFAGIIWIGLLYYFNFVQVPALGDAAADDGGPGGAGITKYVAPRALFWFRWGALATWITGAAFLMHSGKGSFANAFMLGMGGENVQCLQHDHRHRRMAGHNHVVQCLGSYLAEPEESPGYG